VSRSRLIAAVLSLALLATVQLAWAQTREEVAAAAVKWTELFVDDNPDVILSLYAPDAVLWGTLSPTIRQGPGPLREYFVAAFKALPGHKVTFGEQLIRVYGTTAINSGYYTFSFVKDGETKSIPARYTFVYVKGDKGWLIADHHSSAVPAPLR
jgi:uncharacterized protein (TIGR02246 family)